MNRIKTAFVPVKTVLLTIYYGFSGNPVRKAYDNLERAARLHAERQSAAAYEAQMNQFYNGRVAITDPNLDWWSFATARQGQHDSIQALQRAQTRAVNADVALHRATLAYHRTLPFIPSLSQERTAHEQIIQAQPL